MYLHKVRLSDGIWDLCLFLQLLVGPPSSLIRTVVVVVRLSLLASSLGQTDDDVGWTPFSAPTRRPCTQRKTECRINFTPERSLMGVWEMGHGSVYLSHLIRHPSDTNADSGFVDHLFE